jgi:hypothetical protein
MQALVAHGAEAANVFGDMRAANFHLGAAKSPFLGFRRFIDQASSM